MTETIDQLIQARFDAIANPLDDGDWSDVLARARGARRGLPARIGLVAAAVVLAATVTAAAFGWPQTVIDFFKSPPAPAHVRNWFAAQLAAPTGMNREAIPGQARKITTESFDVNGTGRPAAHALYVAPRKGGGFCFLWTDASGGCFPLKNAPKVFGPLGLEWTSSDYTLLVDGWVRTGATRTVVARFADGTTATIPVTWVSAPVNAGFLVYPVPAAHRSRTDALRSIVALDASGSVLGRQTFPVTRPLDDGVMQTLPDGTKFSLPRRAHASQARELFSFRPNGYLWVMPRTGGGVCYLWNRGFGCLSAHWLARLPVLNGGLFGPFYFAQVKPEVAAIELRYQGGESERLTPVDGFVLERIAPAHWKLGARLVTADAVDRSGKSLSTERFDPRSRGIYPCKKPLDLGHGVKECP